MKAATGGKARAAQRRAPLFGKFFESCAIGRRLYWLALGYEDRRKVRQVVREAWMVSAVVMMDRAEGESLAWMLSSQERAAKNAGQSVQPDASERYKA